MTRPIKDEFAASKLSRQQRYQYRCKKRGRCVTCGRPAKGGVRCAKCAKAHRERNRVYGRRVDGSNPWRPGGPGRPPKL